MRLSHLYPNAWRQEFGDEFEAVLACRPLTVRQFADVAFHAGLAQLTSVRVNPLLAIGWMVTAAMNLIPREVQWSAGWLILVCFVATVVQPRRWLTFALLFFSAIPVSELVRAGHGPIYQTSIALIPALIGSSIGLVAGYSRVTRGSLTG